MVMYSDELDDGLVTSIPQVVFFASNSSEPWAPLPDERGLCRYYATHKSQIPICRVASSHGDLVLRAPEPMSAVVMIDSMVVEDRRVG